MRANNVINFAGGNHGNQGQQSNQGQQNNHGQQNNQGQPNNHNGRGPGWRYSRGSHSPGSTRRHACSGR